MTTRTTTRKIHFSRPFELEGIDGPCPAGIYDVVTDEETIEDLTFLAWRRMATVMEIRRGGSVQAVLVDPTELDRALARDLEAGPRPDSGVANPSHLPRHP